MSVKWKRVATTAGVSIVAMTMSFVGVSAALGSVGAAPDEISGPVATSQTVETPTYEENASGTAYGSARPKLLEDQWPQLVQVVADNGKVGYVYRDDLVGPVPTTPEEAAEISKLSGEVRFLPVFESDGVTEIGKFPVGGTNSTDDRE